jgi:hypothetical protein
MKWRPVVLIVLFSVSWAFFACESDVSDKGGGDETVCVTSLDQIDFGKVVVGEFEDTCLTIGVDVEGGHIADTIVIDCPDFHFVDTLSGLTCDTFIYDLTWPADTSFCIRFEPVEAVPTICSVDRGSDCGELGLSGIGALPGYEISVFDYQYDRDLYDVVLLWEVGALACGDSGLIAISQDLSTWMEVCADPPLTTSPLRGVEVIYSGGSPMTVLEVGGGGESNGLAFVECDHLFTFAGMEYITSSLTFADGQVGWFVGKGHDIADGYNGAYFGAEEDTFTLYDKTSEITDLGGTEQENVWAVLSEPSHSLYHFDGETWEPRTEGWMTEGLYGVWVHESGEVFAVGTNGTIYHYTGSLWEDQSLDFVTGTLYCVWGFAPFDVYAVGEGTAVYHYNGDIWEVMPAPTGMTKTLFAVHGLDLGDSNKLVVAVGEDGTVIGYAREVIPPLTGTGVLPGRGAEIFEKMKH